LEHFALGHSQKLLPLMFLLLVHLLLVPLPLPVPSLLMSMLLLLVLLLLLVPWLLLLPLISSAGAPASLPPLPPLLHQTSQSPPQPAAA
jgi:hypothetical protein